MSICVLQNQTDSLVECETEASKGRGRGNRVWRYSLAVKCTYCSEKGPKSGSQHRQPSVPNRRGLYALCPPLAPGMTVVHKQPFKKNMKKISPPERSEGPVAQTQSKTQTRRALHSWCQSSTEAAGGCESTDKGSSSCSQAAPTYEGRLCLLPLGSMQIHSPVDGATHRKEGHFSSYGTVSGRFHRCSEKTACYALLGPVKMAINSTATPITHLENQ